MNKEYIIELNKIEQQQLFVVASEITASPSLEHIQFCEQSKKASVKIPERIKDILLHFVRFGRYGSIHGFLLLKNVPIIEKGLEIPLSPLNNNYKIGEQTILAKIQSMFLHIMGEMVSYEAEGYGRLFQDLVPVQTMAKEQTSIGSVELEIHTEQAFSKLRPDILSLACIRGDITANTFILSLHEIKKNISHEEWKLLHQPFWKTGVDKSFKLNGNEFIEGDIRGPLSIIQDNCLVFDQDLMFGITEESTKLMNKIVDIYYKKRITHNLLPGEIVFIDNRNALHGRSTFYPKYDGYDRFLIRCFAIFNYDHTSYAREGDSHMIRAIYS